MMLLQTLLAFFFVLGVLVVVHELGHYLVARWCGVKVLRFSVGMGRVVWSRKVGPDQTEWALSLLPFGGYVKMLDAREADLSTLTEAERKREFTSQSVWRRIAIVAAGPLSNFLLAILLFAGLYMHGIPEPVAKLRAVAAESVAGRAGLSGGETVTAINGTPVQIWSDLRWEMMELAVSKTPARIDVSRPNPDQPGGTLIDTVTVPVDSLQAEDLEGDFLGKLGLEMARPRAAIGKVVDGGPAAAAGLRSGDRVDAVDGTPIADGLAFIELVRASPGKNLLLTGVRGAGIDPATGRPGGASATQTPFELTVTPLAQQERGITVGRIQAEIPMMPEMTEARSGPLTAIAKGAEKTWDTSVLTLKMLGKMLIGEVSLKNITGPITIADYAGQTARIGLVSYLSFIAFISISLGVMNLLPIPVLDGGHLLYYSVEVLTGRQVSARFGEIAARAGVGVLMMLMVVAVFNDIVRLVN
jgi:regulator of sigma E protease